MISSTRTSPSNPPVAHLALALALVAAVATAMVCAGCGGATAERGPGETPSKAVKAPGSRSGARVAADFTLRDIEGRTVRLSDHRGKVVLLSFWATWCVPCAAELPHLQRLYVAYREAGLVVLAISMDGPESIADVVPHARRYGLTFPVLLDEETRVVGVYNPKRSAPFSALIGRDGVVVKTREGYSAGDEVAIETDIKALLGSR